MLKPASPPSLLAWFTAASADEKPTVLVAEKLGEPGEPRQA